MQEGGPSQALGVSTVELEAKAWMMTFSEYPRGHTQETRKGCRPAQRARVQGWYPTDARAARDSAGGFMPPSKSHRIQTDMVRLLPVVVIRVQSWQQWFEKGRISRSPWKKRSGSAPRVASVLRKRAFVIRIGLMTSPSLREKGEVVGGPWQELGHLVRSGIYHKRIEAFCRGRGEAKRISIRIPSKRSPLEGTQE